ncbi:hypothetical protein MLD38_025919 [Melastoma candidum]|uniref:Uncharacterized protein n=1 Tax=Melastoma candidum TaxID=119954 RepID=A0ACB9P230_9MYRT|nr:hypothetical protein MLD38_025919 [Melastoma candidum]
MMILSILAKLLFLLLLLMGFFLPIHVQGSVQSVSTTSVLLNCKEQQYGGIHIPYPFGIGRGCFLDEWFEIECQSSAASPVSAVPVLKKAGLEVLNITFATLDKYMSTLTVKYPVISDKGCMGNGTMSPLSLRDSPFTFATANLIAFGCNSHALLITPENEEHGCWTGDYDDVGRKRTCNSNTSSCQMIIESVSQEFKMEFTGSGEPKCIYAFFADPDWLQEKGLESISTQKFSR